jgi:hypothetical protein
VNRRPAAPLDLGLVRDLALPHLDSAYNLAILKNTYNHSQLIYDLGWIKFRVAAEYQLLFAQDPAPTSHNESRNRGVAGSMQFVFAPWVEFGPNIGRAVTDVFTNAIQPDGSFALDTSKSGDIWSYGGFVNFRPFTDMLIGAGGNFASFANLHVNANNQHDQATNTQ